MIQVRASTATIALTGVVISPRELYSQTQTLQKLWLVDVRTPGEFLESHLAKSYNHPLSALGLQPLCRPRGSSGPLYLLCQDGSRAHLAAKRLLEAGQAEVCVLTGGMEAWRAAGLPLVSSESKRPWLEALLERWASKTIGELGLLNLAG